MEKLKNLFVGLVLLASSLAFGINAENKISEEIIFSEPMIFDNGYIKIKEANGYTNDAYYPCLPTFTKTFTFDIGTKIKRIEMIPNEIKKIPVKKEIPPSIGAIPLGKEYREAKGAYYFDFYPDKWGIYNIGVGLDKIFLTFELYPIRYHPHLNIVEFASEFELKIIYEKGVHKNVENYDLLIICPQKWKDDVETLKQHKESNGIKTIVVSTDDIYNNVYFAVQGRDDAEKVKYFIKNAKEEWGVKYVLLFGGMKGQRFWEWYVPVRYTNLDDNSSWETGYLSDLYFADLYRYDENNGTVVFDDWDSNGNGIFAEWNKKSKDVLDLYPDIYVGRLPARYDWEVKPLINKIINYEKNAYGKDWFKRMIAIGGDSFPDIEVGTDYIEGQVECDHALSFMEGFDKIRIYVEGGDFSFTPENAEKIISEGAGFVYFSGHGNPASWATHPHNDFETWIDFGLKNIRALSNGEKLPVLIVGGCHNSQFNSSLLRFLTQGIWAYYLGEMTPQCWSELMLKNIKGGSIATIGNTGLGYGTIGDGPVDEVPDSVPDGIPDCIQYLGGWLEPHFFKVYIDGKDVLGETWANTLADYLNHFPIDWSKDWIGERPYTIELVDCKTVQEWVLFGDPSLKIGGYS
ncbi:MAG: peptidase C25 [Thermoplasmatales archaeon]|nr:peptidase C25 [Thermoplasmatales archaeon]